MSKDLRFRDPQESLLSTEGDTIGLGSLDDMMNGLKVFPDKLMNPRVFWDSLVRSVGKLIASSWSFDRNIVGKGLSPVRDLRS